MSQSDIDVSVPTPKPPKVIHSAPPKKSGAILKAEELSPVEQQVLRAAGWDGTSNVPSDLAERMGSDPLDQQRQAQQFQAALHSAANSLPEGFQMPTKDLVLEGDEIEATPDQLANAVDRYASVMQQVQTAQPVNVATPQVTTPRKVSSSASVFEAARKQGVQDIERAQQDRGLAPNIAQAVAEIEDEIETPAEIRISAQPSTTTIVDRPADEKQSEPTKTEAELRKERRDSLLAMIPEEAREAYRDAVVTFQQYTKSYYLFNGQLKVTFRDVGIDEQTMLVKQEAIDRHNGRVVANDLPNLLHTSRRYLFATMLQRVENTQTGVCPVNLPDDMTTSEFLSTVPRDALADLKFNPNDTDIYVWYRFLTSVALKSSLYSVLYQKFEEFSQELTGLQILARDRDFF